jgi:hypothetical protein
MVQFFGIRSLEVDLVPAQRHQLAHPKPVAVGDEDQGRISVAIPANSAGGLDELIDLLRRQVLPGPPFSVSDSPRGSDFPVFESWPRFSKRSDHRLNRGRYRLTFTF